MLDPKVKALATDANFAVLTTLMPDGQPQTQMMWVHADDEHVLINTEVHRAKYLAVQQNPDVTVTIWAAADPYRYAEVRGTVTGQVRGEEARAHIDALSQRYTGGLYSAPIQSERVVLRIDPTRQNLRL